MPTQNQLQSVIDRLGKNYLLHPDNRVHRIEPKKKEAQVHLFHPSKRVGRLTPFNKTPQDLRAALGA